MKHAWSTRLWLPWIGGLRAYRACRRCGARHLEFRPIRFRPGRRPKRRIEQAFRHADEKKYVDVVRMPPCPGPATKPA